MDGTCKPPCTVNTPVQLQSNQMPQFFPLSSGGSCGGTVPPYDPETFYAEGTVISYNGKYYAANADIPAGTPFQVGTSGLTWREVNLDASTIPPFSPTKAYVQYEAVDYLGVLYVSNEAHDARPWDPADFKPLSTSGGVTIDTANTQTIHFTGDGTSGAPLTGEVQVASALPGNTLVATGSGLYVGTDVNVEESDTALITGDGSDAAPLVVDVKVSATAGNTLTANGDGLYVPAATFAGLSVDDSPTIDFSGNGTSGSHLTGSVKRSATAGNSLVANADGLWAPTFASQDTPTIDFTGAGTTVSALQAAVKISATAGNQVTANPDGIYVPVPAAGAANIADTASVDMSGDGTSGSPLSAAVKRSATAGNALTENADGLYVATVTPGIASVTSNDSPTIDFSGAGTSGSALTAAVRLSATALNGLTANPDGLWAPKGLPTGGSTGAILRKVSGTNFDTEWANGVRTLTDSATARTLALTDQDLAIAFNNAAGKTVTVPTNATVALPVGAVVMVINKGVGNLTVAPASGVTVLKPGDQSLQLAENNAAVLLKFGTNEWFMIGGMIPL